MYNRILVIDMTIKLGQVLTPSLTCLQLNNMFVNNNRNPQLIKMFFPYFSQYLKHPSRYVCETSQTDFDGPMWTHVFKQFTLRVNNNKHTIKYTYSPGMKERCRDGCRTSLLIAGVVLVPAIFHTLLPPCHLSITIHFMEIIFSTL